MSCLSPSGSQSARGLGGCPRLYQVCYNLSIVISSTNAKVDRWIYVLIITVDANYRLKLKEKGIKNDPALGDGFAHWVESKGYNAYVKKYGYQVEVRTSLL